MKLSHKVLLLITAIVAITWLIYNTFGIREYFSSNTIKQQYYFSTDKAIKRQGGTYEIKTFPANATKINSIDFYTCTKSNGEDVPSSYTNKISGSTIDSPDKGTSVQFTSPSFNKKGQNIGTLSIHSNPKAISSMNPKMSIALPCNINQKGEIAGTDSTPGSTLVIRGISNANFNNPNIRSKKQNNVMVDITYTVPS
jgi:hypothetical protein